MPAIESIVKTTPYLQNLKKSMDPLTLGAGLQGVLGLGKSIFGGIQAQKARKRLEELEKQRPKSYVPSAIIQRASEPIAEEFMEAQEMGDQRRTSQGIAALSQAGARGILGGLPSLTEQARRGQMQRMGQYEQARRDALGILGGAQERVRQEERQDFLSQVAAERAAMGAGTQNIFTGADDIAQAGLFYATDGKSSYDPSKTS